jgi:hypothetical protein
VSLLKAALIHFAKIRKKIEHITLPLEIEIAAGAAPAQSPAATVGL